MDVYNSAQELNAYALGYALDDLSVFSFNQLFGTFAFGIALDHKLLGDWIILRSTSISVSGQYKRAPSVDGEPAVVHLIHGHSKDKRPALK